MKIKKAKDSYYEIKKLCKDLKERNLKKRVREKGRFEDVPKHISDKDKEGRVFHKSHMDFYLSVKHDYNNDELLIPSGLNSTDKNYV